MFLNVGRSILNEMMGPFLNGLTSLSYFITPDTIPKEFRGSLEPAVYIAISTGINSIDILGPIKDPPGITITNHICHNCNTQSNIVSKSNESLNNDLIYSIQFKSLSWVQ